VSVTVRRPVPLGPVVTGFLTVITTLGAGLTASAVAADARPPAGSFRFVTFNTLHGGPSAAAYRLLADRLTVAHPAWSADGEGLDRRVELASRELRKLAPDVVALQEASVGAHRGNVAERLARDLGFQWVHAPATSRLFALGLANRLATWLIDFDEGPAVLSRFPIVASDVHDLPRCVRFLDPRVLLHVELATPVGPLHVFSTHTSHAACQLERLAQIVERHRGALPAIVMGDFNHVESSAPIRALRDVNGFVDAFRAANPDAPGATVWQPIEVAERRASRRVDYVFLVPGRRGRGRIRASRVVLDKPARVPGGGVLWPSDHYGVLADIDVATAPEASVSGPGR
jgi:endonuclease/exonuclease/phosphatase family metal-dependent hydrolase